MYKTQIFIGSSSEALPVAKKVEEIISTVGETQIWKYNFFDVGVSAFDNLCDKLIKYDFAVFIGLREDLTRMRDEDYYKVRDNVIFEYGLFTGILGKRRTFLLTEQGTKLPTDLDGITIIRLDSEKSNIQQCCEAIISIIDEENRLSRISLLPSAASAISYFENFIIPVCNSIAGGGQIKINGSYADCSVNAINIIMPETLTSELKQYAFDYYKNNNLIPAEIEGFHKTHSVYIRKNTDKLEIYDIPVILISSYKAISLYLKKDFIGESEDFQFYINKEIFNFAKTLELLIKSNYNARKYAKIKFDLMRKEELSEA